jgi:hypothetical protein
MDRGFLLAGTNGEEREYDIPFGARMMVDAGAKVSVGDQLTSRSKPTFIAAEGEGKVLKLEDRIIIYNPDGRLLRFPLTMDLLCDKGHGEAVRQGERIVHLELPPGDLFHVEEVKDEDDVSLVDLRPRCSVEIDQMATVRSGDKVKEGDLLTKGVVAPHALLETAGVRKTRQYLLTEIHKVYKAQGVDINDKHLEVIIRQILNNVRIVDRGDSHFLIGDLVMLEEFQDSVRSLSQWNQEAEQGRRAALGEVIAEDLVAEGELIAPSGERLTEEIVAAATRAGVPLVWIRQTEGQVEIQLQEKRLPIGERELLRISKAALQTKGWLSAASFQRTTKVLAEAALRGEVDELEGLKPNIIVGKRIPAGTGFPSRVAAAKEADLEADDDGSEAESEAKLTGSATDL